MRLLGIIGGSGLAQYPGLEITEQKQVETPYGEPSAAIKMGTLNGKKVAFLPRHGDRHSIPPHRINYRANIHALKVIGVTDILAVAAVGGITDKYAPGVLSVPDQIIDYTYGREMTLFDDPAEPLVHVDFSWPFDSALRNGLKEKLAESELKWNDGGCYAATQGPRLETAAEITRLERDGCDIVGMTGMPEAVLARELALPYAMLSLVVNPAAGKSSHEITMAEIEAVIHDGMANVCRVLADFAGSYTA